MSAKAYDLIYAEMYLCKTNPDQCDHERKTAKKASKTLEMLYQEKDWYEREE